VVRDHDHTLCRSHVEPGRNRGAPDRVPGGDLRIVRVHRDDPHVRVRVHSGNHKDVGHSSVRLR